MLHTTFTLLKKHGACVDGYKKLARHLGGVGKYGDTKPISLLVVLKSNGFDDAVWSLRATMEDHQKFARSLARAGWKRIIKGSSAEATQFIDQYADAAVAAFITTNENEWSTARFLKMLKAHK